MQALKDQSDALSKQVEELKQQQTALEAQVAEKTEQYEAKDRELAAKQATVSQPHSLTCVELNGPIRWIAGGRRRRRM